MALILSRWLNGEVQLSVPVTADSVEAAFRSGHLFAELLHRRGVPTPSPALFIVSPPQSAAVTEPVDEAAAIHNFSLLEPVFQSINVPITAKLAADIIKQRPGAAVRTIYAIRSALFALTGGSSDDTQHSGTGVTDPSTTGTLVLNQNALLSHQKKRFHQKEHEFFVEQLKRKLAHGGRLGAPPPHPADAVSQAEVAGMKQRALESSRQMAGETRIQEWRRETEATERTLNARLAPLKRPPVITSVVVSQSTGADSADQAYLTRVKAEHDEQDIIKLEQSQRRARLLQEQINAGRTTDADLYKSIIAQKLQKQSKQEQRIADQLHETKQEKVAVEQRSMEQDHQYAILRDGQFEAALRREHAMAGELREEYRRKLELYQDCYVKISEQRKAQLRKKHTAWCGAIVQEIINFAILASDYGTLTGGSAPSWKMSHLKCLFLQGHPVSGTHIIPVASEAVCETRVQLLDKSSIVDAVETDPSSAVDAAGVDLIDAQDFQDYIAYADRWSAGDGLPQSDNPHLAAIVDRLLNSTIAEPKRYRSIPQGRHLKLCILGKPLSGKQVMQRAVLESYGLKLVDPIVAVASLQQAASYPEGSPWIRLQELLRASILNSGLVDDQLLAEIVFTTIREIEQDDQCGWLLVNFPQTVEQARILEKLLTGYEEPKPVKPGNIRNKEQTALSKKKSLISASGTVDDGSASTPPPQSGIDMVLLLDINDSEAIKRAVGGLLDPATGRLYHTEYDPPSTDQPTLLDQLTPVTELVKAETLLQAQLITFSQNLPELRAWYEKFQIFQPVDASPNPESVVTTCIDGVLAALIAKRSTTATNDNAVETSEPAAVQEKDKPANAEIATVLSSIKNISWNFIADYVLHSEWIAIESSYTDAVKFILRGLRRDDETLLRELHKAKMLYRQLMGLEDGKQQLIDSFVTEFNNIEDDFMSDPEVKSELHLRTDELRERLWEISDSRREDADTHRQALVDSRWIEDHAVVVVNYFIGLVQLELDRFTKTRDLIVDYTRDAANEVVEEGHRPAPIVQRLDAGRKINNLLEDLLRPKKETANRGRRRASVMGGTGTRKSGAGRNSVVPAEPASTANTDCMGQLMEAIGSASQFISDEEQLKHLPAADTPDSPKDVMYSEANASIKTELVALGSRMNAITHRANMTMGKIVTSARDLFVNMEEISTAKYQAEMEQIKQLYATIKGKIESEQRLPPEMHC